VNAIKICGFTRAEDAIAAAEFGVDFLGLVFYERSPRFIPTERAKALVAEVHGPHPSARFVGVFVDEDPERILQITQSVNLCGVQLHGGETPATVERLMASGLFVIKAHRIAEETDLAGVWTCGADAELLDTRVPGVSGGTGMTFDWSLAVAPALEGPLLLAGGLTPKNVGEAVRTVRPWGVDVSSGVEIGPGIKSTRSMRRFVETARTAFRNGGGDHEG